jgi:small multidrug resistance family-3 protein
LTSDLKNGRDARQLGSLAAYEQGQSVPHLSRTPRPPSPACGIPKTRPREPALRYVLSLAIYVAAGFAEIAGCFSFWLWLKEGRSPIYLIPGVASLILFAALLTRIDSATAGRAYAAYGGVYITTSLLWLRVVEGRTPDRWEVFGALICLGGAGLILLAPRAT